MPQAEVVKIADEIEGRPPQSAKRLAPSTAFDIARRLSPATSPRMTRPILISAGIYASLQVDLSKAQADARWFESQLDQVMRVAGLAE
jgi:hypothetical protein